MKKLRKPNSTSKLDSLKPASRVAELRDGLLAGWSYAAAKEWLLAECGVTTTGDALGRFFQRHCVPVLQEGKKFAAIHAEAFGKAGVENKVFEDAAMSEAVEFAFQFLRNPEGDPEAKRKWLDSLVKKQGQDDARAKLTVELEAKARAADEAAELKRQLNAGGKLMPEQEREAILDKMDEILGLKKK
jgi:hypothetical protein